AIVGPFQFFSGDRQPLAISSPKIQALLAYLAIEAGYTRERERLAALLWQESPKTQAFQNLRQSVARLQKRITDNSAQITSSFLQINKKNIQLNKGTSFGLDCDEFSSTLAHVHSHDHAYIHQCHTCCQQLEKAL